MDSQDVLDRAYQIVMNHPIARGKYAEDADGKMVETSSPLAVAFCAAGAIHRAADELGIYATDTEVYDESFVRFFEAVQMNYEATSLHEWSDRVSDEEVRDMFRRVACPLVLV